MPVTVENHALNDDDYDAIASAVMETARGRWFLDEYARRNRHAETEKVLEALARMQERWDSAPANPNAVESDATASLINRDVIDLAEAITQVKKEVRELGGQPGGDDHFNSATSELESIVSQTESATSEILEAAEKVQEVLWTLREDGASSTQCDIIESKVMEIYTACSFQDLTGQRSSKVVRLVGYIERRVQSMMAILGLGQAEKEAIQSDEANPVTSDEAARERDRRSDASLLNGPASPDTAQNQGSVDAVFEESEPADTLGGAQAIADDAQPSTGTAGGEVVETSASNLAKHDETDSPSPEVSAQDQENAEFEGADVFATSKPASAILPETSEHSLDETGGVAEAEDPVIIKDSAIVEIHDAEILQQPIEPELIQTAVNAKGAAVIFEVEQVDFGGSALRLSPQESDEPPVLAAGIGAFDLNEGIADIFETETASDDAPNGQAGARSGSSADQAHLEPMPNELLGQDVFEPDLVESEPIFADEPSTVEEDLPKQVEQVDEFGLALSQPDDVTINALEDSDAVDKALLDAISDAEEVAFDNALEALESDITMALAAQAEPETAQQASDEAVEKPKPRNKGLLGDYTDAERIALFS